MTQTPDANRIMAAIDATWPPAEMVHRDGWVLRRGDGGGQRASAASGSGDIALAEDAMRAWDQAPLFRMTPADGEVDARLDAAGYEIHDPVVLYAARAQDLAGDQCHLAAAYRCQFRPAIMEEIWAAGGIGPARLALMDRVQGARCFLMSRADDRPAGVAFLAVDGDVAMIHAIEVLGFQRRKGAGVLLMELAARVAMEEGAEWLALAVTTANTSARALYARLGMAEVGTYHYRRPTSGTP